jgi:hypothetical protein
MSIRTPTAIPAAPAALRWGLVALLGLLAACGSTNDAMQGPPAFQAPSAAPAAPVPATPTVLAAIEPTAPEVELPPLPPLVFVRQGNVWRSDGSSNEPRRLTDFGLFTYTDQPAVSPADGRIAFVAVSTPATSDANPRASNELTFALTVMDSDGSNQQVIWEYTEGQLVLPSWSVDGSALYVTTAEVLATPDAYGRNQRLQGMRVPLDGAAPQLVVENAIGLAMAPDGSGLTYVRVPTTEQYFSLMVAAPDGSAPQEILAGTEFQNLYSLRFSADGERLVFAAMGGPPTDEQGNPLALQPPSPLEQALRLFEPPTAAAHGDPWGVWTINRDGTALRLVLTLFHGLPTATFSPDGMQLAVMDSSGIYLLQSDGSQVQQIDYQGDSGGLVWVP